MKYDNLHYFVNGMSYLMECGCDHNTKFEDANSSIDNELPKFTSQEDYNNRWKLFELLADVYTKNY